MLYGCVSWTMTKERQNKLRAVQRKMLRIIIGVRRKRTLDITGEAVLEDWVQWIQRSTHEAERIRQFYNIPDWNEEVDRRKFRWAGHVARRKDNRWTKIILEWALNGMRTRGRPCMRWCDSLNKFFFGASNMHVGNAPWMILAQNREKWRKLEEDYIKWCGRH